MYQISPDFISLTCSDLPQINWLDKGATSMFDIGVTHVWVGDMSKFSEDEIVLLKSKLPFDTILKSQRFRSDIDRRSYQTTRGMLQQIIFHYTGKQTMPFAYTEYGKPFLPDFPNLSFNISHSGQYVLIAFRFDGLPVGVDIEQNNGAIDHRLVAKTFFHPQEQAVLDKTDNPNLFYKLWTRKEALLKTMAVGMTDEMKKINVLAPKSTFHGNGVLEEFNKMSFEIKSFNLEGNYFGSLASAAPALSYFFVSF